MKLSKFILPVLLLCGAALAQTTHEFTFGKFDVDTYTGTVTGKAEMQTLDGLPADQSTGYAGVIEVAYNETPYWGLQAPQVWGFPNNGDLLDNTSTPPLSAPVFTDPTCNLRTAGCVDYETGTANFVGYGQGVTVSVTVWFQVHRHVGRFNKVYYTNDETNGSGTATF